MARIEDFAQQQEAGMQSAIVAEIRTPVGSSATAPLDDLCKQSLTTPEPCMSDEEREQAAYRAGVAMQAWYSRYQRTGDPKALDTAYRCLGHMRELLAGRSPAYVAFLERQRGLDLPACANEERGLS